jgi:hypothetical protein
MAMKEGYMRCEVSPGMFSSEYSVVTPMGNDKFGYSWVDKSNVIIPAGDKRPGRYDPESVEAFVRVIVLEERADGTLVTLPYETLNQRTFLVNPDMVDFDPA